MSEIRKDGKIPLESLVALKPSATIAMSNTVTLMGLKGWNVLLSNAFDNLMDEEIHRIRVSDLAWAMGYDSKDIAHLTETLEELGRTTVRWNVLRKDKHWDHGWSTLLAECHVVDGYAYYSYAVWMRHALRHPKMYAKINLAIQQRFRSKHALALYEMGIDYLREADGVGESPYISIEDFRERMGLEKGEYPNFKFLNERVIRKPILEVNAKSDIRLEVSYAREERQTSAVKFRVRRMQAASSPKSESEETTATAPTGSSVGEQSDSPTSGRQSIQPKTSEDTAPEQPVSFSERSLETRFYEELAASKEIKETESPASSIPSSTSLSAPVSGEKKADTPTEATIFGFETPSAGEVVARARMKLADLNGHLIVWGKDGQLGRDLTRWIQSEIPRERYSELADGLEALMESENQKDPFVSLFAREKVVRKFIGEFVPKADAPPAPNRGETFAKLRDVLESIEGDPDMKRVVRTLADAGLLLFVLGDAKAMRFTSVQLCKLYWSLETEETVTAGLRKVGDTFLNGG